MTENATSTARMQQYERLLGVGLVVVSIILIMAGPTAGAPPRQLSTLGVVVGGLDVWYNR